MATDFLRFSFAYLHQHDRLADGVCDPNRYEFHDTWHIPGHYPEIGSIHQGEGGVNITSIQLSWVYTYIIFVAGEILMIMSIFSHLSNNNYKESLTIKVLIYVFIDNVAVFVMFSCQSVIV